MNMNGNKSSIQSLQGPPTICLDSYASELAIINQWIWARNKIQLSVLDNKKFTLINQNLKFAFGIPAECTALSHMMDEGKDALKVQKKGTF